MMRRRIGGSVLDVSGSPGGSCDAQCKEFARTALAEMGRGAGAEGYGVWNVGESDPFSHWFRSTEMAPN
eukprot:2792915-Rhodomonas_salina.1